MFIIATDLDRTLFPNGNQTYDQSMSIFSKIVEDYQSPLIYVTGRDLQLTEDGMRQYGPPAPQYLVGEVGTKIYRYQNGTFSEDLQWIEVLRERTEGWDIEAFKKSLEDFERVRLQEEQRQNAFKLSYYIDDPSDSVSLVDTISSRIEAICEKATIVYSVDETHNLGLLDILPLNGTKADGLEYIREKEGYSFDDVIYSGDSGNDLLPLTHGYWAILVANAIDEVKEQAIRLSRQKNLTDRLYIAKGIGKLNGNYVSGIIEGLIHFGRIDSAYAS